MRGRLKQNFFKNESVKCKHPKMFENSESELEAWINEQKQYSIGSPYLIEKHLEELNQIKTKF